MEEVFDKDETGYLRWAATNQKSGYIVNTDHDHRSPVYPHGLSPGISRK